MQNPDLPQPVPALAEQAEATDGEPLGAGAEKTFRPYDPNQILLLPPNLSEWLPAGPLARLINELVDNVVELGSIYASYRGRRGGPPYGPREVAKPLVYGYAARGFQSVPVVAAGP